MAAATPERAWRTTGSTGVATPGRNPPAVAPADAYSPPGCASLGEGLHPQRGQVALLRGHLPGKLVRPDVKEVHRFLLIGLDHTRHATR